MKTQNTCEDTQTVHVNHDHRIKTLIVCSVIWNLSIFPLNNIGKHVKNDDKKGVLTYIDCQL